MLANTITGKNAFEQRISAYLKSLCGYKSLCADKYLSSFK
ncbi:hypothetical protein yrohd0001_29760 [Yersinia rohdei ATCC 43380]|nr:hypothetical protein yrohd0001_29760 [Yersinia rohdei ATCC 43380]